MGLSQCASNDQDSAKKKIDTLSQSKKLKCHFFVEFEPITETKFT